MVLLLPGGKSKAQPMADDDEESVMAKEKSYERNLAFHANATKRKSRLFPVGGEWMAPK